MSSITEVQVQILRYWLGLEFNIFGRVLRILGITQILRASRINNSCKPITSLISLIQQNEVHFFLKRILEISVGIIFNDQRAHLTGETLENQENSVIERI